MNSESDRADAPQEAAAQVAVEVGAMAETKARQGTSAHPRTHSRVLFPLARNPHPHRARPASKQSKAKQERGILSAG